MITIAQPLAKKVNAPSLCIKRATLSQGPLHHCLALRPQHPRAGAGRAVFQYEPDQTL